MSQAKSPWVVDVAESGFEKEIVERSHQVPVIVDFWAPWCGPCRHLGPILEKLAEEHAGAFVLAKVNVDEAPAIAGRFQVESIPAVMAFRAGKPVVGFVGALPESQLRSFLARVLPSESETMGRRAVDLEQRNPAEAERLYRQALELDRNESEALVGLARLLMDRGEASEAAELLERVEAGGEHSSEAERLKALLWLQRQAATLGERSALQAKRAADPNNARTLYELGCVTAAAGEPAEALKLLLEAAERDRQLASTVVKEAMVKIFHVIGVRSELADDYRDRLAKLLY